MSESSEESTSDCFSETPAGEVMEQREIEPPSEEESSYESASEEFGTKKSLPVPEKVQFPFWLVLIAIERNRK
ncbi:Uncharacterized protein APZ42_030364 [Daphnia magna]|uniref:Uncharacterized protein n=1 Tax=Daphnia magna TaxID=35525 RepID=A0A164NU85_9CRUS|nr:Uncharacterized protein APZ42_030364 [Daphnia magna]